MVPSAKETLRRLLVAEESAVESGASVLETFGSAEFGEELRELKQVESIFGIDIVFVVKDEIIYEVVMSSSPSLSLRSSASALLTRGSSSG